MGHGFSKHPAYIVNMLEHDGMKGVRGEKLHTCKKEQEGRIEMILSYLLALSRFKDNKGTTAQRRKCVTV